jgi:L-aspartate oxidase
MIARQMLHADVVVVGAGLAGLTAALALAPRDVVVLANAALGDGAASGWAQGGIAAAVGGDDAPALHARDTEIAGAGLSDPVAVARLTEDGPGAIAELVRFGAPFDRDASGALALGREAAHSRRRIVHANGDGTGRATLDALVAEVRRTPSIRVIERTAATDLVLDAAGTVRGVEAGALRILARAVVLATGGAGHLYRYTTNPAQANGDGIALALRAGARLADMEFVQFHPTALATGRDPMPLVTEALRGEGATLIDATGRRFCAAIHPDAELAPRDVVARAVYDVVRAGGRAYLDARTVVGARFPERFPTVFGLAMASGVDPRTAPIPIAPAAHYHMGGVLVDLDGRSSLAGLWACGEVSSTGVHGANRLASNSLLEAVVYAQRAARDIAHTLDGAAVPRAKGLHVPLRRSGTGMLDEAELRALMFANVGVVRDAAGLGEACTLLAAEPADPRLANATLVARAIATAAYERRESRGSHFRTDYPVPRASEAHRTLSAVAG